MGRPWVIQVRLVGLGTWTRTAGAAGGWPSSSNNRGELTALLELLKATAPTNEELHVLADSQYVINSVTKWIAGWKANGWRKAIKNQWLMLT